MRKAIPNITRTLRNSLRSGQIGLFAVLLCLFNWSVVSASLVPGDIAFVGLNSDGNSDEFAFVALGALSAGETIYFTDRGWDASTNDFRPGESWLGWTVPGGGLAKGTVVTLSLVGALSNLGDQLTAYQLDGQGKTQPIAALNNFGSAWQATANDEFSSALPRNLSDGHTGVALSHMDNMIYSGSTSGTRAQLLALIHDPNNWGGNNSYTWTFSGMSFSVGNGPAIVTAGDLHPVAEAQGTYELTLYSSSTGSHGASLVFGGGTATNGMDLSFSSTPVSFATSRVQTISLNLTDDTDCEGLEVAELQMQTSGFAASYANDLQIQIADNDALGFQKFQGFESSPADNWNFTYSPATYNTETNSSPDVYGTESVWDAVRSFSLTYYAPQGDRFWGMQDINNLYGGGSFWHNLDMEAIDVSGIDNAVLSFRYFTFNQSSSDQIEYAVAFDNGSNWSSYTALPYSTAQWIKVEVNVPNSATHVRLRVRAKENAAVLCGGVDEVTLDGIVCTNNFSIVTGTVPQTLCVDGAALNVPFTSSGTFANGNVFTAELSDAQGNFSPGTPIGTLAASGVDPAGAIPSQLPANLAAGTGYRIRVVSSAPSVIGLDNGLNIALQQVQTVLTPYAYSHGHSVSCAGASDGSINTTISGGASPYSFAWTGPGGFSSTNEDPSALSAGNYTVVVTDANGCTATGSVTLTEPNLAVVVTSTGITCFGANDGAVAASGSGGASPYTFDWSGPNGYVGAGASQTGLAAGTYSVVLTDAYGCTAAGTVQVTEPAGLSTSLFSPTNPCGHHIVCAGGSDGMVDLTVNGGTAPFSYQWTGPNGFVSAQQNISGLTAGSYAVTVTDANGCQSNLGTVLTEPSLLNASIDAISYNCGFNVSCHGASDGRAFLVGLNGGCPPYSFEWSNGDTSNTADGLSASNYTVTITDAGGCSIVRGATLSEPGPLTTQVTAVPASCTGVNNGAIDLTSTGGCLPHQIQWTGPGGFSSQDFHPDSLFAGIYDYTLTDPNGCSTSGSIEVIAENNVSATLTCCQDTAICEGESLDIAVQITGQGPFELVYLQNGDTVSMLTGGGTELISLSPSETVQLELISVTSLFSGCEGTVCGTATIGVNDCNTPCEDLCVNAGIVSMQDDGSCRTVEMELACDTACVAATANACPGTRVLSFDHDPDGNPIPAGTVVDDQWASMGVTFSFVNNGSTAPVGVIFDSSNPTGGDLDLGTPNQDFGGPGIGSGGAQGAAGQNDQALGNLLVLAENTTDANNDGLIDDPDDEGAGGELQMNFAIPLFVESLSMVDLDNGNGLIRVEQTGGRSTDYNIPGLGDNAVTNISLNLDSVVRVRVILPGSGGISALAFCPAGPEFVDISIPCGTVSNFSNTAGLPMEIISRDSITGITGLRIHGLPSDCFDPDGQGPFTVSYEICGLDGDCGSHACLPMVGYGRNGCVQYEMAVNGTVIASEPNGPDKGDPEPELPEARIGVFPNPVLDAATAELFLREGGLVKVEVYNAAGLRMGEVLSGELPAGESVRIPFRASEWPAGMYFLRMQTSGGKAFSGKFVLMP